MAGLTLSAPTEREREPPICTQSLTFFSFFIFLPGPVARTNLPRTTFTLEPNHDRVSCYFILRPFCCPLFHSLKVGRRHKTTQATHNDNLLSLAAKTTLRHVVGRNPPPLTRKMKLQLKKNIKKTLFVFVRGTICVFFRSVFLPHILFSSCPSVSSQKENISKFVSRWTDEEEDVLDLSCF